MSTTNHSPTPWDSPVDFLVDQFIAEAREYVGCPWLHQGRTKNGIDCVGLILNAGKACGLHDYDDTVYYTRRSVGQDLLAPFRKHASEVPLGTGRLAALQLGDILILRDRRFPQHAGIIAEKHGRRTLIHSSEFHSTTLEEYIKEDHERKALTAFRFRFLN